MDGYKLIKFKIADERESNYVINHFYKQRIRHGWEQGDGWSSATKLVAISELFVCARNTENKNDPFSIKRKHYICTVDPRLSEPQVSGPGCLDYPAL